MILKAAPIVGIVTAAVLIHGAAVADTACGMAPTPERAIDLAHASADQIDSPAAKATALTRIAVAEAAAGYVEQSDSSLALAQLIADGSNLADGLAESEYGPRNDEDIRAMLYQQIAAARARSGASLAALSAVIDEAQDLEYELMLTFVSAQSLIESGRTDDARPLIERLVQQLDGDQNSERAMAIRSSVIMMYVQIGDLTKAKAMVGQLPDNDEMLMKVGLLLRIAEAQRTAGDEAGAEATLLAAEQSIPAIENTEMREMAGNMVSSMRTAIEKSDTKSAQDSGSCPADLSPYGLAIDKAKFGYFAEAVEMALALENPEKRDSALSRISSLQSKDGQADGAYDTALMIAEPYSRSYALGEVIRMYAKEGNADGVWFAAQSIEEEYEKTRALSAAIAPLVAAGNPAGAAMIVGNMLDPAQRAASYVMLAESLLRPEKEPAESSGEPDPE